MPGFLSRSESNDLQNLNRMITRNINNPDYRVKSKQSKFYRKSLEELIQARDKIEDQRKGERPPPAPSPEQLQESAKRLRKTPLRSEKERIKTSFKQAVDDTFANLMGNRSRKWKEKKLMKKTSKSRIGKWRAVVSQTKWLKR